MRETSSLDSRAFAVRLTAKGRALTQKAVVAVEDADDEMFGGLSDTQLGVLKKLMVAVIGAEDG